MDDDANTPDGHLALFDDVVERKVQFMKETACGFVRPSIYIVFERGDPVSIVLFGCDLPDVLNPEYIRMVEKTEDNKVTMVVCSTVLRKKYQIHEFGVRKTLLLIIAFSKFQPGILTYRSYDMTCTDWDDLPDDAKSQERDPRFEIEESKTFQFTNVTELVQRVFVNPLFQ